jgi:RNA polymerase sigma-70 factor (ECF subfamily)
MARTRLDADRLAAAYERDGRRLLVFFTRRTYDAQLAVDLVAENEALRHGRAERRALRRLGVQPPQLDADEQARIEELAALGELRTAVRGALAELGPEQREAVRLRVVDELGCPAIATRLGISEQAARARVSRGLRALAGALDHHQAEGLA